ncbi:MAG: hypothetical protein WDO18_19610 [Acidobacteriota bacterium]
MPAEPSRVKFGAILAESVRLYLTEGTLFGRILLTAAIAIAAIYLAVMSNIVAFAPQGATIDVATATIQVQPQQWVAGGIGFVAALLILSFTLAASVHVAAGARTVRDAFGQIRSRAMQIFWLQLVVYILAVRYSPFAAPVLLLLIALAVPVALREDLGPSGAADRAWELSEGHRTRILLLELGLVMLFLVAMAIVGGLFLAGNGPFVLISPVVRALTSWAIVAFLLAPIQFMFVTMTRLYMALAAPHRTRSARPGGQQRQFVVSLPCPNGH